MCLEEIKKVHFVQRFIKQTIILSNPNHKISYGRTRNKVIKFDERKLSYKIELFNDKFSPNSAFLSVNCIVILSDKATLVDELARKKKKDLEIKYEEQLVFP